MESNGSPATRAELGAHVKGIDEHFDTVERDVSAMRANFEAELSAMKDNFKSELSEIKGLIEGIYQTFRAERKDRSAKWRAWGPPIVAAMIALGVSVPVALFAH